MFNVEVDKAKTSIEVMGYKPRNFITLDAESLSHGVTSYRDFSDQIQHMLETYFNNPERIELESVKVKAQNVCTRAT